MESAFGVDHGEISKGLPSALRGAKIKGSGFNLQELRTNNRIAAHDAGQKAAKYFSSGSKDAGKPGSYEGSLIRGGKQQKGYFKQGTGPNSAGGPNVMKPQSGYKRTFGQKRNLP